MVRPNFVNYLFDNLSVCLFIPCEARATGCKTGWRQTDTTHVFSLRAQRVFIYQAVKNVYYW